MKELTKNEMQAVSGAGLFDSVLGIVGNIFEPVRNAIGGAIYNVLSPILTPVLNAVAQGVGGVLAKFIELLGNKLNDNFGPKQ
ncbi:bacteriocin-type signal sequence-containing protein [Kosakonia radicincitans]|uniref:bacteriocin n=1 Tax=Kosakonia radicincitans TaxID=283686 RepID=UPI0009A81418|nr:bacteriocin [Kosakonia radicincitans]SKC21903.1 bacteriocin-type signal sequence-containing protein [Kosakonia radicincitans]